MRFPPGDLAAGKQAFIDLGCASCHTVDGAALPKPVAKPPAPFTLGGAGDTLPSDGELFTAIVNPSHRLRNAPGAPQAASGKDGDSRMPDFGRVLTVQQLVDVVAWLQSKHVALMVELPRYSDTP